MGVSTSIDRAFEHADATARAAAAGRLRHLGRRARQLAALGVVLLLAACSSIKLGYNHADTLLVYTLDSYFDLDDAQEQLARERLRELMAWHRATQLSRYAAFMEEAQRKVAGPVSADDVLDFQNRLNQKLQRLGDEAAPELARLALTLQPAQIDHFADKLARDNSKARRELVRFAGRQTLDERVKEYAERAQDWFGSLTDAQLDMVRSALAAQPADQQWWMDERERRQQELVALLRRLGAEQPSEAVAADWLRAYFGELALPSDPQRRARVLEFRRHNAVLTAQLINSASAEQRQTLARKLGGYADDFSVLAANGGRG